MGVITISIGDKVEKEFRKLAAAFYRGEKGYLGKAITEAMREWSREKSQEKVNKKALSLLEKGFEMGKLKAVSREELHARD